MKEIQSVLKEMVEKKCYDIPDFVWNLLELKNINGSTLNVYYEFLRDNLNTLEGDIVEFGVFRGASLFSTAILLKSFDSDKKVYGFDSFSGFPPPHRNDDKIKFESLYNNGEISKEHYKWVMFKIACEKLSPREHSFDNTTLDHVKRRIELFELDNIVLVPGELTKNLDKLPERIIATLYDCDLYSPYADTLPAIYERTVSGGLLYFDEYYSLKYPGPRIAVDEFCKKTKCFPTKSHFHSRGGFERWYLRKH